MARQQTTEKFVPLPGGRGMDNRSSVASMPDGAVRSAVNVDVLRDGSIRRRAGYTKVATLTAAHSLFCHGGLTMLVEGGSLRKVNPDYTTSAMASVSPLPASYAVLDGDVYLTNTVDRLRVSTAGTATSWAVPNPGGQPSVAASATGGLDAGAYQVAITYRRATGEEGGASLAVKVQVAQGGGISLSAIPQPGDASVSHIRVYASRANGDILYFAFEVASGVTTASIGLFVPGKALETQFLDPLPAGHIVRAWNGRLLVADGSVVWLGEPYRKALCQLERAFIPVDSEITVMEAVVGGVFVATERAVYFVGGTDPKQFTFRKVKEPGAIKGTGLLMPATLFTIDGLPETGDVAVWFGSDGWSLGMPDGSVQSLTDTKLSIPRGEIGATLMRDWRGVRQLITVVHGGDNDGRPAEDGESRDVMRDGRHVYSLPPEEIVENGAGVSSAFE